MFTVSTAKLGLLALLLLLCADFALPMTPGAYQPLDLDAQSILGARLAVQATTAVTPPPLQPRPLDEAVQALAPLRPTMKRREPHMVRTFAVPLARSPQHEVEALNTADPA